MKETLYRVSIHNRKTLYEMHLFVWGTDPMDVIDKLQCLIGKYGCYQLDGVSVQKENGVPMEREAMV